MSVKFVFSTLVTLLATITFFALDAIANLESASDEYIGLWIGLAIILIVIGIVCFLILLTRKTRAVLKEHRNLLSSEDPKVLLELSEKCDEFLKDGPGNIPEVVRLAQQAKTKATRIQNLTTFKSEISKDGSHPRVVSTFKEHMHNPDSFQHVSSEYEDIEKDGKHYYKITMACRGTNTFDAL